ncbi:GNAT family N-acetyltransferase [archaeon]|nr:GNAT family N-acetyltransferase [archaeon]
MHEDAESRRNFNSVPESLIEAKKEIKEKLDMMKKKKGVFFAIDSNDKFIGFVGVHSLDGESLDRKKAVGIIGVGLQKEFRGKGIARRATKLFVDYVFKKYKLGKISGRCRGFNKASVKLMEKCDFVFESRHKKEAQKNGKFYDNLYYVKAR